MLQLQSLIESVTGVFDWISNLAQSIVGVFSDVDFTILYDWMPADIQAVITALIVVLMFLALLGLIKKVILFFS